MTFGGGKGVIRKADGTIVVSGKNVNGMYILEAVDNTPDATIAMTSLAQLTSLEQWHRRFTHCSPLMILEMANKGLVEGLKISEMAVVGKCEDCILGRQTRHPFDGTTERELSPLDLVSFDLWGPSRVQSVGGKVYLMILVDAGTSYKHGAYLPDKSDATTIEVFDIFRAMAKTTTGQKIRRLRTDRAYESNTWREYCQRHGITHEFTAPYSSAQNGLAECAIRTTMDDVRTLLRDSDLGHSYWAEAAAYSIDTQNLIPSRQHPGRIPQESFTGKRQGVAHLRIFGSKCWVKTPVAHGGSKLDPRSSECQLLGYATESGNYKVQDIATRHVFVSRDVIFEEGSPHRTTAGVGEQIPLFDANMVPNDNPPADNPTTDNPQVDNPTTDNPHTPESAITNDHVDQRDNSVIPIETRRSARVPQPSQAGIQSNEYKQREILERGQGKQWATDQRHPTASTTIDCADEYENVTACFTDTTRRHPILFQDLITKP